MYKIMKFTKLHIALYFHILLLFPILTLSQPQFTAYGCNDVYGNYTKTSQYFKNLQTVFTSITSNTLINYGFYNLSVGEKLDVVNGIALCRSDISTPDCKTCIHNATKEIASLCPNQKAAAKWYETCMLRYSSRNIFKGQLSLPYHTLATGDETPNPKRFNHTVSTLMTRLANEAALGDSRRKFATGEVNVSRPIKVYGLVQCIPDMEDFDCLNCLKMAINQTLVDYYGHPEVEAAGIMCRIRFATHKFYKPVVALPPLQSLAPPHVFSLSPPSSMSRTSNTGNKSRAIRVAIAIIIPGITALMFLVILIGCYIKRRKPTLGKIENGEEDESEMDESFRLDFNIVKTATDNFSSSNKLGQGGFDTIYKGIIPKTGKLIAVKRLSSISEQGYKEFQSEALLIAKLQHKNLVKWLGYSLSKLERLLVYEFVPNKSLDLFLFDPIKRANLNWLKRYNIIGGIVRGLLYLHEESRLLVVHRDLKASNVLLDEEMNPKISDFGMARLFGADQTHANTSRIAGTYGYMAPEYVVHGHFSFKTDVFSFGVLVLEIISGQKVTQGKNGESLLSFAWRNWLEGNALNLLDTTMSDVNTTEVLRCINIGLLCVQENAAKRPIMSSVFLMLNSYSLTLPVPSRPAFLIQNDMDSEVPIQTANNRWGLDGSVNEASLSSIVPR